ncbi:SRPBCC family protein [Streptomyces albus subsp. chlorinus]|uniref:SRPBCC family protein n=1 Tax=Streptomyces albus TaxID=1888 RepID=UPI00156F8C62|nr:SRPBCC family protein [Streptomyces albus]NSC24505.1 SRPBCC family protein [Streptomyces albus subsp. chlorinus]
MSMELGIFVERDGLPAVRLERPFPVGTEQVWRALTESDLLAAWFPSPTVRMEQRVGGHVEFAGDPYADDGTGTVLEFDPPSRLAYTWSEDELLFELGPRGEGCLLALTDVLEERGAAARNAAGWDVCLDELEKLLTGGTPSGPHSGSASDWRARYDAYVAAGMPSGAPIPEGGDPG